MWKRLLILVTLCVSLPGCPPAEVEGDEAGECDDGVDNDQDGALDCDDDGCAIAAACNSDVPSDEVCDDGIDNDGDGVVDEGDDLDGDGFWTCGTAEIDCNDSDPEVHPAAGEACDGEDGNCDGVPGPDEVDADGDGCMVCEGDPDDSDPSVCGDEGDDDSVDDGDYRVSTTADYVDVACGFSNSCALRTDGSLTCWGADEWWDPSEGGSPPTPGLALLDLDQNFNNGCGRELDATIACWGPNQNWQATPPPEVVDVPVLDVSSVYDGTCFVRASDGTIGCWGNQLSALVTAPPSEAGFEHLDLGSGGCAWASSAEPVCWGGLAKPPQQAMLDVSVGAGFACGIGADGSVVCWGNDQGSGATSPSVGAFASISCSRHHCCGVLESGELACWGSDEDPWDDSVTWGQATPPTAGTYSRVSAGRRHTCAVRADGYLVCWGADLDGESTPP